MSCRVSEEQLWSWVDRQAPELEAHLAECPRCRALAAGFRAGIQAVAADSRPSELRLPKRIGSYAITGLLGEGGQGIVYRAEQESPKRPVALKVLKGSRVGHFRQEIQSLARLNHPTIATIFEADETEFGQHFFAMELVDGVPLDEYVRAHGLTLPQRLDLFCKVCAGVQYAHENEVIHRDLKPSNILINAAGDPKILDFGLARLTNADVTLTLTATETGKIVGTLRYMSPEQARGDPAEIDARTDVYSLGVVLYELMTDRPPFEPSSLAIPQAIATICETPPRRPGKVNRALRGDLEIIVLKALEKERSQRYQSVAELCQDVGRYLRGEPIRARPPSGFYVLRKTLAKHPLNAVIISAVLVLGIAAVGGGLWWRARDLLYTRHTCLDIQRELESARETRTLADAKAPYEAHPELPEACLVWAQARFRAGRCGRDQTLCNQAVEILQQGEGRAYAWACRLLLADIYGSEDSRSAPLRAQGEREAPDTDERWYERSFATLDTRAAQRCAETAVQRNPRHALGWERLAHLCALNADFDLALEAARRLMQLGGDRYVWTMFEAHVLNRQGRHAEAQEQYTRLIPLSGPDLEPVLHRAAARLCARDYKGAVADYSLFLRSAAGRGAWTNYKRATPSWILGRHAEAAADYREALRLQGFPASYAAARLFLVLEEQARLLEQQGRPDEAQAARIEGRRELDAAKRNAAPESRLAHILRCLAGELTPDALVAAADPANSEERCEAYYYAGERCLHEGDRDAARRWFEQCVATKLMFDPDQFPPDPMNEYHLAVWRVDQLAAEEKAKAAASSEAQPAALGADGS